MSTSGYRFSLPACHFFRMKMSSRGIDERFQAQDGRNLFRLSTSD
jgi:hypothetical protein